MQIVQQQYIYSRLLKKSMHARVYVLCRAHMLESAKLQTKKFAREMFRGKMFE